MSILQPEASIWYAVCCVIVCIRYVSKRMRLGTWRGLQADDYIVVPAMVSTKPSKLIVSPQLEAHIIMLTSLDHPHHSHGPSPHYHQHQQ